MSDLQKTGLGLCLAAALAGGLVLAFWGSHEPEQDTGPVTIRDDHKPSSQTGKKVPLTAAAQRARREELDATVWKDEVEAQRHEETFIDLWDRLRSAADPAKVLGDFAFQELKIGGLGEPEQHDHQIQSIATDQDGRTLTPEQWRAWLSEMKAAGFHLAQSEWHHARFVAGAPAQSVVTFVLDVENNQSQARYRVKGALTVTWQASNDAGTLPLADKIDATDATIYQRLAEPVFEARTALELPSPRRSVLIAHDLDGDGLSELLSPTNNLLFRNKGGWQFEQAPLFAVPPPPDVALFSGALADFTGDGRPDFIGAARNALVLYVANEQGEFATAPREVSSNVAALLIDPMLMTVGDIDGDSDLDVWLGQYKQPYKGGQMPTPYYDANDGFPCFLLINDGAGNFSDRTDAAGLSAKRHRRTYSAALVDLDQDSDLDLAVVSDFSGIDLYLNDGKGNFQDVTAQAIDQRHAFGMALSVGDYNLDSQLDLFMVGMSSTTAKRLHALGLGLEDYAGHQEKRPEMGYGNRMYLAGDKGSSFRQASFNADVARTGWSWGSTSFDFDNDGDLDIYVANGNRSGKTAKDYCTKFWRHDIYTGSSVEDRELDGLFETELALDFGKTGMSWNGFEHNALLMNEAGRGFLNVGYLAGVASEIDSRNVLSDDLDGDGWMDLIVMGRPTGAPAVIQLLRNRQWGDSNWIGLRLEKAGRSPLGATVRVFTESREQVAAIVSGDSYASQHAPVVHFGLGDETSVKRIEISWPDGERRTLSNPTVNRYNQALPRKPAGPAPK